MDQLKLSEFYISNNDKFNNTSENIARYMLNKIIGFCNTEFLKERLETKVPRFCSNYLNKLNNTMTSTVGIFHDRDDTIELKNKIFYNNVYNGINEWMNIDEPVIIL